MVSAVAGHDFAAAVAKGAWMPGYASEGDRAMFTKTRPFGLRAGAVLGLGGLMASVAGVVALGAGPASATGTPIACGMTITASVTLTKDLICTGTALWVDQETAERVTLDLGGHSVSSDLTGCRALSDCATVVSTGGTTQNGRLHASGGFAAVESLAGGDVYQDLVVDGASIEAGAHSGTRVQNNTFVNGACFTAADMHVEVVDNRFVDGPPGATAISGVRTDGTFDGNTISGYGTGISIDTDGWTNHVRNNTVLNTAGVGISLIGASGLNDSFGPAQVTGNYVSAAGGGGLILGGSGNFPTDQPTHVRVTNNVVLGSGGDGIHVADKATDVSLATNLARANAHLGIDSPGSSADGGGNIASGNGNPAQCVKVMCAPSGVALTATATNPGASTPVTLTATSSFDVGPTEWALDIVDATTNKVLTHCGVGTACATTVVNAASTHVYKAIIAKPTGTNVRFQSAPVQVTWHPSTVALQASPTTTPAGSPVTLTAIASEDVGPTDYAIVIVDVMANKVIASCGIGWNCTVTIAKAAGPPRKYVAKIAKPNGLLAQATSPTVIVTWQ